MNLFLILWGIFVPSFTFVFGAALAASRYQRRLTNANEEATDRLVRELALAEMHGHRAGYDKGEQAGFDKGRVDGVAVGISLRDQIDEIGDYSQ